MNKSPDVISNQNTEDYIQVGWNLYKHPRSASPIEFRQKVGISFDRSQYTVKSVENSDELLQAISLRQEVFRREFCQDLTGTVSDLDELDMIADHLIVIDNVSHKVIGNYRLISSLHSHRFYSQSEFSLTEFLGSGGDKLELSRSCVHSAHRCGIVMQLLWRGVIEYMRLIGARYLFGCTSVKTIRGDLIAQLTSLLDYKNAFTDRYRVEPLLHCRVPHHPELNGELPKINAAESLVPPIMKGYLRAGAQLSRCPAVDMDFQCTDFFTILDRDRMRDEYARKYLG
jgi:putative hemolysin